MSFFVTSANPGKGGDLGGLAGADAWCGHARRGGRRHRQEPGTPTSRPRPRTPATASAAGPGTTPRARRSPTTSPRCTATRNGLTKATALDEKGDVINGRGDTPNRHDILTGSHAGRHRLAAESCGDWTMGGAEGAAMVGHSDRTGLDDSAPAKSWNSSQRPAAAAASRPSPAPAATACSTASPPTDGWPDAPAAEDRFAASTRHAGSSFCRLPGVGSRKNQTDRAGGRPCTRSRSSRCSSPSLASGCAGAPRWRRATRRWPAPRRARSRRASPPGATASAPRRSPPASAREVFDAAFQGVGVNADVVRLDGKQAEFTKPIWEYLDSAASPTRVETGRAERAQPQRHPRRDRGAATASTARRCWRSGAWSRTTARTAARSR